MRVELEGISKWFGSTCANNDVTLCLPENCVLGLVGENGAGKTTLMKILSGYLSPDRGRIRLDGEEVRFRLPADALRRGIGMLHQDPCDVPSMTVEENYALGRRGFFWHRNADRRELIEGGRKLGFELDPESRVGALTVGERQQLEILRLLSCGVKLLILDEPTTGLSDTQRQSLFAALRKLVSEGCSVILVSHKLRDIESLCDEVVVMRGGRVVGRRTPPLDLDDLVKLMFGQPICEPKRMSHATEEVVLGLEGLQVETATLRIGPISLEVRAGEVIGLAGVEGSGQGLFLRACCGLLPTTGGRVLLRGRDISGDEYVRRYRKGVVFVPANRLEEGLLSEFTIAEHVALLEAQSQRLFIPWASVEEAAARRVAEYRTRGSVHTPVKCLSGGNQQRVMLSLIPLNAQVLLIEHPTRGLDVSSADEIWEKLEERCRSGAAILFSSAELDEILQRSDRVLVFCGGAVRGPFVAADLTTSQLGEWIGGRG